MRSSRRVTILGLNYAPEPTGNAPYTTALAQHCAANGDSVTVVTSFPHYPQWRRYQGFGGWRTDLPDAGVRLIRVRHWVPRPPRGARRLISELTFGARQIFTRWSRPDTVVLVSPALFATALCMVRLALSPRVRRVVWVQDLYSRGLAETGEGGAVARRVTGALEGWTLRRAHMVVAIHPDMAARMGSDLGVSQDRIRVIANWGHIVPSMLTRDEARAHVGWSPEAYVVLHAGNMGVKQGLGTVVEAARLADREDRPVQFVLLGDGAERESLEASAKGISSIIFVDPLAAADFPIALAAADALLVNELPGVRAMAVPSKLTSYFAAGRPVIAAGVPDGAVAGIMARAKAGPTVGGGDPSGLLDAVHALRESPADSRAAGEHAASYWRAHMSSSAALTEWDAVLQATSLDPETKGDLT